MTVRIVEDDITRLAEYARVSIGFTVSEVFDARAAAAMAAGELPVATPVTSPYWKDYDAYPGGRPTDWPKHFDVSRWILLTASIDHQRVGGAAIIYDDPQIDLLRNCEGCALLWDLRVTPEMRGRGVGSALLGAAERVAVRCGAQAMRVETQQINVPACRLYARLGFRIERVVPGAYTDLPDEVQLIWRKALGGQSNMR
jgi:ribosomal protein S18 acetylase RimI-like enzyme